MGVPRGILWSIVVFCNSAPLGPTSIKDSIEDVSSGMVTCTSS